MLVAASRAAAVLAAAPRALSQGVAGAVAAALDFDHAIAARAPQSPGERGIEHVRESYLTERAIELVNYT